MRNTSKEFSKLNLLHVPEEYRKRIWTMLRKNERMWSGHLGEISTTEHKIELIPGSSPVCQEPCHMGSRQKELIEQEIEWMCASGVICPSSLDWASPAVLVPKKDGKVHFCVDYRRLNLIIKKERYPIPRMEDCADSFRDAMYFTSFDASSSYWQLRIAKMMAINQRSLHM